MRDLAGEGMHPERPHTSIIYSREGHGSPCVPPKTSSGWLEYDYVASFPMERSARMLVQKNRDPSGFSLQGLRPWQQRQAGQGTFLRAQQNHCLSCHDRVCPLNVHFPPASRCSHAGHSSAALSPVQPPWLWEMPDVSHGTMPRPSSPRRLRYQPVFGQMVRDREAALKFRERKLHPGKLLIEGKWEVQGDQQGDASCLQPLIGSSPPTMKTTLWFTPAPTFSGSSTSTMPGFYQELPTCTQKLWST
ncbi:apolipoprotein D isoform 5-T19 [Amazona ochrocephala]